MATYYLHLTKIGPHHKAYTELSNVVEIQGEVAVQLSLVTPQFAYDPVPPPHHRLELYVDEQPTGRRFWFEAQYTGCPWDSTTVPDGLHSLSLRLLEKPADAHTYWTFPALVCVNNHGQVGAQPQAVPIAPYERNLGAVGAGDTPSPMCDVVQWPGALPPVAPMPLPVVEAEPFREVLPFDQLYVERMTPMTQLFAGTHHWSRLPNGQVLAAPSNTRLGDDYLTAAERLDTLPLRDGPRGVGYLSGYLSGAVHPETGALYFVEQASWYGRIGRLDLDGTVTTLAGHRVGRTAVPLPGKDFRFTWEDRHPEMEHLGVSPDQSRTYRYPMDLCLDPRDPAILYVTDSGLHRIVRIDTHATPAVCTTYAGVRGEAGYRDGAAAHALFREPFTLAMASDGTLYVGDRQNHAIRQIAPDGTVSTLVGGQYTPPTWLRMRQAGPEKNRAEHMRNGPFAEATIVFPMCVRLDSQDNLYLAEDQFGALRHIDVQARTVRLHALQPPGSSTISWVWFDVDRTGAFGPVDRLLWLPSHAGTPAWVNEGHWWLSPDGQEWTLWRTGSRLFEGRLGTPAKWALHYPWFGCIGADGSVWGTGFGLDGVVRLRKARAEERRDVPADTTLHDRGFAIWRDGTVPGFPVGSRPSFMTVGGYYGWNPLGTMPHFDNTSPLADAEVTAMIQAGWGGQVPRPEITGNDLRNLLYFIRRNSVPSARAGVRPGPTLPDRAAPVISDVQTRTLDAETVEVTWQTSKPCLGLAHYGTQPAQYFRWSAIEEAYTTAHQATIGPLLPDVPYYVAVRAKDAAGNQALSSEQTVRLDVIPPPPPPDTEPPAVPPGLQAVAAPTEVHLTWEPVLDAVGYVLTRDGVEVGLPEEPQWTDRLVIEGMPYWYTVAAVDGTGNLSPPSPSLLVTTPYAPRQVTLTWADGAVLQGQLSGPDVPQTQQWLLLLGQLTGVQVEVGI